MWVTAVESFSYKWRSEWVRIVCSPHSWEVWGWPHTCSSLHTSSRTFTIIKNLIHTYNHKLEEVLCLLLLLETKKIPLQQQNPCDTKITHTHNSTTRLCSVYQSQDHRSHLPGCPGNPVIIQSTEQQLAERAEGTVYVLIRWWRFPLAHRPLSVHPLSQYSTWSAYLWEKALFHPPPPHACTRLHSGVTS